MLSDGSDRNCARIAISWGESGGGGGTCAAAQTTTSERNSGGDFWAVVSTGGRKNEGSEGGGLKEARGVSFSDGSEAAMAGQPRAETGSHKGASQS